jgi:hypothetical protein
VSTGSEAREHPFLMLLGRTGARMEGDDDAIDLFFLSVKKADENHLTVAQAASSAQPPLKNTTESASMARYAQSVALGTNKETD